MRNVTVGLVVCAVVAAAAAVVGAVDPTYVGADKCKMCHKTEYNSWLETGHAKTTEKAKASTERKWGPDCLKCHATNSDEALAGVQCEACHGPGSEYKNMKVMKDRAAAVAAGLVVPTQATCDGCHTGADHAEKVDFAAQKGNTKAIHAAKAAAPAS